MELMQTNFLAVIVAAVAAFIVGAVFYGTLSKPWMAAARIKPEDANMSPVLFATTFVMELLMALVMAVLIGHFGAEQVTMTNGALSGLSIWIGFIMPAMVINNRYQGFGWDLTFIDGAHWLLVTVIMGAIIGWFGA